MPDPSYVRIFDTTLRDGEQSPGATMTSSEKLEVGRALARLGVDVIEAGFPAASPDDFAAVRSLAEEVGMAPVEGSPSGEPPIICGLARATPQDIEAAWNAVKLAKRPRIHTFLSTSELHMKHKLKMTRAEVLERVRAAVTQARSLCPDVEFSPEDASRTEPDFLYQVLAIAIECGATTLNIPDTVGYRTPDEYGGMFRDIIENVPGIDGVILSAHCHDDLGLATANTLAAISNGARQVEVTINGIGERAGNCALEEIVMALRTRARNFGVRTGIDAQQLTRVSRLVATCTGMVVQANKAVVGANAFAHESGIHQDGMLKHGETYEIMSPETVGAGGTKLVLGKHSGRHAFGKRMAELGYALEEAQLEQAFHKFKRLAERKKQVSDADLQALVAADLQQLRNYWALEDLQVGCGTMGMPTASVRLRGPDGACRVAAAVGTGPVDAAYRAIDSLVQRPATLLEYAVHAVTEGIDALGEVSVRIAADDNGAQKRDNTPRSGIWHGHGADTDIIVASVKAYLAALNRMLTALDVAPTLQAAAEEAV